MNTKIGAMLPHLGTGMGPATLVEGARRAEELEYDTLWVVERLLYPTNPRSPYPVTPDGSLPKMYARSLTPIETLSYVAAHTAKIAPGAGVLNMPLHNPVMLARQLATIRAATTRVRNAGASPVVTLLVTTARRPRSTVRRYP